jgi:hyperosmotically inducible protein
MKTLIATLLATAATSSFAFAPTAALNHDPATYRNVTQKAAADYKTATAKCTGLSGNDKDVCTAEAKAARARAEADAIAQYNNTEKGRASSRKKVADADYALAKQKCDGQSGAAKDSCMDNAKAVHTAALADVKADREVTAAAAAATSVDGTGLVANTNTREPAKADAVDKCAQVAGAATTGCLITNRAPVAAAAVTAGEVANRTGNAAERAVDKTKELAQAAVDKTRQAASAVANKTENAVDRSRDAAATTAQRSENALERAGDRTRDTASTVAARTDGATDRAAEKTEAVAGRTAVAASDTAITTKVKANIFKEPGLKSMAIHVETEQGVVMLSGFVESKAEADKAVKVAKSVDGVTNVKSALKVK